MLTFGSLFAGIGGFDLGLERAGLTCSWQVEIDDFCTQVLEKQWPEVRRYSDVQECGKHNLESVDVICGGFPCQDVSVAGHGGPVSRSRQGLEGPRSGLWYEFSRIISELKPNYVIIENVPGLLTSNRGRDFATVCQELVQLGYNVQWRVFDARWFGVPQQRRRVYIVASARDIPGTSKILFGEDTIHEVLSPTPKASNRLPCVVGWDGGLSYERLRQCVLTKTNPAGVRESNGIPGRMDRHRYRALGNAVVPAVIQYIGEGIISVTKDTIL